MNQEEFITLAGKVADGTATPPEIAQYNAVYDAFQTEPGIISDMDTLRARSLQQIQAWIAEPINHRQRLLKRIAVAATVLFVLGFGAYRLLHNAPAQQIAAAIKPGGNKAILTLSSGRQIVLNNVKNGLIARQANTQIQKTADGQLTYSAGRQDTAVQYNTLTTPKGGRYEGILADGTRFILDAASSITYPVQFPAEERIVTITGQAYFAVKHDAAHPFKVLAGGQSIQDIGTEFNVNAYADEPAQKNTLVSGSIKVSAAGQTLVLKPGQQSIIANGQLTAANADVAEAIAWKNGQTTFKDEDLQTIMRQVSRWYDVEVRYEGQVPQREFAGGLSRNADFKDLLKILSFYNVHYTLNNKTITITP